MKKSPSRSSQTTLDGDFSHLDSPVLNNVEVVMSDESDGQNIWVDRSEAPEDSNILITLSNQHGTRTSFVGHGQIAPANASHFVETPKERVKSDGEVLVTRALKVGKVFSYALLGVLVLFSAGSATGYMKARVVLTGSMVPAINPGDIVITMNPKVVAPKVGDVVSYQAREFSGKGIGVFSHRIIGGSESAGWLVKGDHNPSPDIQRPKGADILGVVVFTIPFIGKFLTRQALFFLIPIIIGFWIAFEGMKEAPEND